MRPTKVSRRELLGAIGLAAGTSVVSGCGGEVQSQTPTPTDASAAWQYVSLVPGTVAAEAYRLMPEGGCMYAAFTSILTAWGKASGQSVSSFPVHMMKYGEGGIGGWGTVCGALNGGAAIIGLFEKDRKRRGAIIAELFSWYESTRLPSYLPNRDSAKIPATAAESVLCHVSVGRWCETSGNKVLSKEMNERCRRLTADVAAKTVELLNKSLDHAVTLAPDNSTPRAEEAPKSFGKMKCITCHEVDNP